MGLDVKGNAASEFDLLALVPNHVTLARVHNVAFMHWKAAGTEAAVAQLRPGIDKVAAVSARGMSLVALIDDGAGVPTPDGRQALSELMVSISSCMCCLGIVLRGAGFWASAMQSVLTGMRLEARPSHWQMRFARDADDLGGWFREEHATRTGVRLSQELLAGSMALVVSAQERAASPRVAL